MFLQNRYVQSNKDMSVHSSGVFHSARIRHSSHSEEEGVVESEHIEKHRRTTIFALPKLSLWANAKRLLLRAKKKVLRAIRTHGLKLYSPVTLQKAWAPRPHHVSFAGTMWIDLTMVGVLYRLDEFFLASANDSFSGFWIPYVLFLAVYDAWEVGPLLQAEFRNHGISLFHSFLFLVSWLLLALLGASIPYDSSPVGNLPIAEGGASNETSKVVTSLFVAWAPNDQLAFASIKLAHALVRVVFYADIMLMSKSKRARIGALPRFVTYACGTAPLIAAVVLVLYAVDPVLVALCFLLSFLVQKFVWNTVWHFDVRKMRSKVEHVRTNMPFVITRLKDWTQLQLGACVLGLITENLQTDIFTSNPFHLYFVLVSSYFFLALMDLHSYSSEPRVFHDHALIVGGVHSLFWFELFTILGLSLLGVAVGLRYVFQRPPSVPNDKPFLVWLLVVSSITATMAILLQEANHHTARKSKKGRKRVFTAKMFLACSSVVAPAIVLSQNENAYEQPLYLVTLNLAISTLLVLIVHAYFGGFRKEVAKKTDFRLNGRILAALIARAWLHRARRNIAERERLKKLKQESTKSNSGSDVAVDVPLTVANDDGSVPPDVTATSSSRSNLIDAVEPMATPEKPLQRSFSSTPHTMTPLDLLAATFAMTAFSTDPISEDGAAVDASDASVNSSPAAAASFLSEDTPGASVLESTEIFRAIASFRKRSTMLSVASFSRSLLIEDDDNETVGDEDEAASVVDQEKDLFEDETAVVEDDDEDDEVNQVGPIHESSSQKIRTFHAPTIEEGDEEEQQRDDVKGSPVKVRNASSSPVKTVPDSLFESDNPAFTFPTVTLTPAAEPIEQDLTQSEPPVLSSALKSSKSAIVVSVDSPKDDNPVLVTGSEKHMRIAEIESNSASVHQLVTDTATPARSSERKVTFNVEQSDGSQATSRYAKYLPTAVRKRANDAGVNASKPARIATTKNRRLMLKTNIDLNKTVTTRVLKKVLNDKFYERPHLLAAQDVFAEYTVSWSDLFLDIVYVGVVYRLGDYLAQGLALRGPTALPREPLSKTIFLFASLFFAIFSLWWAKLGFSAKCGITDVFHKVLDIVQALIVLVCAANVMSPLELGQKGSPYAFVITGCLVLFHITMLFLWFEISMGKNKSLAEIACSRRNIRRCLLSIGSLTFAFLTTGLEGPLEVISVFWSLSWLLPVVERFATINWVKPEEKAPFLLRYVLHRLGDGALILLGEGVFQIIRVVDSLGVVPFAVFTLCFINMALARMALFQMDCFDEHAKKHAVFNSRFGHVAVGFMRSLASPAIVGMGVALKLIVSSTSTRISTSTTDGATQSEIDLAECIDIATYELLCFCSLFSLGAYFSIYHLHRTFYFRYLRWRHLLVGWLFSGSFLIFPWIPCVHPLIVTGGCALVWFAAIIFHNVTDDLFSSKDDQGVTLNAPKSENDQEVGRRATRVARKSMMKLSDSRLFDTIAENLTT